MYKCINTSLFQILKDKGKAKIIENQVIKASAITRNAYFVLRKFALQKYYNGTLPDFRFTKDVIKLAIGASSKNFKVRSSSKLEIFNQLNALSHPNFNKIDITNMSIPLEYYAETMLTSIEVNIKNNFDNYVRRYINVVYDYRNSTDKSKLKSALKKVKYDILYTDPKDGENFTADAEYHDFVRRERKYLNVSGWKLKKDPQHYLNEMIYMNEIIQEKGYKQFQFFPIQVSNVPRSFQFDTGSIIYNLGDETGKKDARCLDGRYDLIWKTHFDFSSIRCNKNYKFDYCIITNGVKASVRFIKSGTEIKKGKYLTLEQKAKNKSVRAETKTLKSTDVENAKINYITEITPDQFNAEDKFVYIDPGKRSLLTMLNGTGQFKSFTNAGYIKSTGRLKYRKKLQTLKEQNTELAHAETDLSGCCAKSVSIEEFDKYITTRAQHQKTLDSTYHNIKCRKWTWYIKINQMRCYNKLVQDIKAFAGKRNPVLVIGDWGIPVQLRNFISTPNLGLKNWLSKCFEIYEIDEYNTSKIIHHTHQPKTGHLYNKHPILTYQMENKRQGCINRDRNSCCNIRSIVQDYLANKPRNPIFCRTR